MGKSGIFVVPDIHIGRQKKKVYMWDTLLFSDDKDLVIGKNIVFRLRDTVNWINSQAKLYYEDVAVVFIGDMTESATTEQFEIAQEILSYLDCPYFVVAGNHDMWPYDRDERGKVAWEAEKPWAIFQIEKFVNSSDDDWKKIFAVKEQGGIFQNYAFSWQGVKFIVLDNVNRQPAWWNFPGVLFFSKFHQRTKQWAKQEVASAREDFIIIFSHAPLSRWQLFMLSALNSAKIFNVSGHLHKWQKRQNLIRLGALYIEPFILGIEIAHDEINFDRRDIRI